MLAVSLLFFTGCWSEPSPSHKIFTMYEDPDKIEQYLQDIAKNNSFVSYKFLGNSEDGAYPISKIIISDTALQPESEPKILIVSAIHGDETTALYLILKSIEYLVNNYSSNPRIKELVDTTELHFIPVLNPWGVATSVRYNNNSVDLNRNFEFAWQDSSYHGAEPFDQVESRLLRNDALANEYLMNLTFHAGEACISTVWDYIGTEQSAGNPSTYSYELFSKEYLPNADTVFDLAQQYSDKLNQNGDSSFYMVEGYDWYACYGTIGDWMFAERGSLPYTIEVSTQKSSDDVDFLDELWRRHWSALLVLLESSAQSFSGVVTDIDTGAPLKAKILLNKQTRSYKDPQPYSLFSSSSQESGYFSIFVDSGTYLIVVEADGYSSESKVVSITKSEITISIKLKKIE